MGEQPVQTSDNDSAEATFGGRRLGRRALLLGAAATGAGAAVSVVATASPASAATGGAMLLGENNSATDTTTVSSNSASGLQGLTATAGSSGVIGVDTGPENGRGVYGESTYSVGVYGLTSEGLYGVWGNNTGEGSLGDCIGVYGTASDGYGVSGVSSGSHGTVGSTTADGYAGVAGNDASEDGGVGIYGTSGYGNGVWGIVQGGSGVEYGTGGVIGDSAAGMGVIGVSSSSHGVYGGTVAAGAYGVVGEDISDSDGGVGVFGGSNHGAGVQGTGPDGVYGYTYFDGGYGTLGLDLSSDGGVGVYASTFVGTALAVDGPSQFSTSGLATVKAKKKFVTVAGVGATASSLVLATVQGQTTGISVEGVVTDASTGSLTIYLTAAPTNPVKVAWFFIQVPVFEGTKRPAQSKAPSPTSSRLSLSQPPRP